MKLTEIENRVRQITWPAPPEPLRSRVLSTAVITAEQITWSDRLWFSRAWRLSALTTALLVVGLELLSSTSRPTEPVPTPQALAEAQGVEEIGRQAGLPQDAAALLARRALSASVPRTAIPQWTELGISAAEGEGR
jgi:hypothetical protein